MPTDKKVKAAKSKHPKKTKKIRKTKEKASSPEIEVKVRTLKDDEKYVKYTYLRWGSIILGAIIFAVIVLYLIYHFTKYTPLAEFDGGKITRDQFVKILKIETGKYDPLVWKNEKQAFRIKSEILYDLIEEQILLNMAEKQKISISDDEMKSELESYKSGYTENTFVKMLKAKGISYDDWVKRKKTKYTVQKLIKQNVIDQIEIDKKEVKQYYRDNITQFSHPEQVRARQILVSSWEEAENILKELRNGANFAAVAKNRSISPDRWKGGDLGYFSRGSYPEIFERVCFNTPVGEISQVIRSDYGYHIFKVIDKRGPYKESLKDAEPYIVTQLQQKQSKEAFEKWFKPIYDAASVEINTDLLKQIEVTSNGNNEE